MINNQTNRQLDKQTLLLYIYKYDYSKLVALDETHNMYGFKTNISECKNGLLLSSSNSRILKWAVQHLKLWSQTQKYRQHMCLE